MPCCRDGRVHHEAVSAGRSRIDSRAVSFSSSSILRAPSDRVRLHRDFSGAVEPRLRGAPPWIAATAGGAGAKRTNGLWIGPMLSRFDDYPIHQTAEPIAHPASSDRNVYDRYWFNGYASDGEYYF